MPLPPLAWSVEPFAQPFFDFVRPCLTPLLCYPHWPTLDDYNTYFSPADLPQRYVLQEPKPPRKRKPKSKSQSKSQSPATSSVTSIPEPEAPMRHMDASYDGQIILHHQVPTRVDNWHDFYNCILWKMLPQSKHAIHSRQLVAFTEQVDPQTEQNTRLPGQRTRERDTLTLFDEGGIIALLTPDQVALQQEKLTNKKRYTCAQMQEMGFIHLIPFGHALYEAMTYGHTHFHTLVLPLVVDSSILALSPQEQAPLLDVLLAQYIQNRQHLCDPYGYATVTWGG